MKKSLLFLCMLSCLGVFSQSHTIGLIKADQSKVFKGYTLIYPSEQPNVYLLDNCGKVVHTWEDSADYRPGNSVFLLENGTLLKTKRPASTVGDPINGPGAGATVEMRDWNNNLLWTFTLNDSFSRLHHDITPMPNGNILMVSWDSHTKAEAIAKGRNPATMNLPVIWPEKIIEVQPVGKNGFNIVWEWREWDHLIQDFDSTKAGYGNVAANPQKININWGSLGGQSGSAWTFINSIDYDETRDQILVSTRFFNEIWVIDHSTTTSEAAGSTAGNSKLGGDLLFRWGNPAAYKSGTAANQKTFSQHTARWLSKGPSDPNYGKVILFNNMAASNYSTVNILKPVFDPALKRYEKNGGTFLPSGFDWTYKRKDSARLYSTGFGSAQLLPNGNVLICSGRQGNTFEVTPQEEVVWEYVVPFNFGVRATQGDSIPPANNSTFRAERFPVNFPGFAGKDMTPKGYIELKPDTTFCQLGTSISNIQDFSGISVYPNPAGNRLSLQFRSRVESLNDVTLSTMTGAVVLHMDVLSGDTAELNLSGIPDGLYILSVNGQKWVHKLAVEH